jgi:hypothetical protein
VLFCVKQEEDGAISCDENQLHLNLKRPGKQISMIAEMGYSERRVLFIQLPTGYLEPQIRTRIRELMRDLPAVAVLGPPASARTLGLSGRNQRRLPSLDFAIQPGYLNFQGPYETVNIASLFRSTCSVGLSFRIPALKSTRPRRLPFSARENG